MPARKGNYTWFHGIMKAPRITFDIKSNEIKYEKRLSALV